MLAKKTSLPSALYVHIPFCARKCNYCDFNSSVSDSNIIDLYLAAIDKDMCLLQGKYIFHTIFVGGGTPTLLTETQLEKLLSGIAHSIQTDTVQEYTIEANPGTLTMSKARLLKDYSVNRVSLGVQSFQDNFLSFLGRIHSRDDAIHAFTVLRTAGFENINLDLMFGCSKQSLDSWKKDLVTATELNPEHLSTYALTYEEETNLMNALKSGIIKKLNESIELDMYKASIEYLSKKGFTHYEISNFAKPRYECKHNKIYWKNLSYVGIGAGAYSFIHGIRSSNEKDILTYIKRSQENKNLQVFCERLENDCLASETIVMSLRLRSGISNTDFTARFGYTLEDRYGVLINKLTHEGFVCYDRKTLSLTKKGLFLADSVLAEFI
ncbi:MAG: radical SAM family heme chaperone HemW [Candidatus Brocadiaceae bacterium]|nr:radical SAM family heme chaperone HemW [Candidatus Brocadiaceae bacterium]